MIYFDFSYLTDPLLIYLYFTCQCMLQLPDWHHYTLHCFKCIMIVQKLWMQLHWFSDEANALTFVSQVMQHACSLFKRPVVPHDLWIWVLLQCIFGLCELLALTRRSFICTTEIILLSLLNEPITVEADAYRDCSLSLSFMTDTSLAWLFRFPFSCYVL